MNRSRPLPHVHPFATAGRVDHERDPQAPCHDNAHGKYDGNDEENGRGGGVDIRGHDRSLLLTV